jgi:hypothetical protein
VALPCMMRAACAAATMSVKVRTWCVYLIDACEFLL